MDSGHKSRDTANRTNFQEADSHTIKKVKIQMAVPALVQVPAQLLGICLILVLLAPSAKAGMEEVHIT